MPSLTILGLMLGILLGVVLAQAPAHAQSDTGRKDTLRDEGQKLFQRRDAQQNPASAQPGHWSVVVFTFRGDERARESAAVLEHVRTDGMLPEAQMEERGPAVAIVVGRFDDPQSAQAQAELRRVRAINIGGRTPYAGAFLAPPSREAQQGRRPEFNLLRVREQGDPAALYTLQIAAYGREDLERPSEADLAEARRQAETAAAQLRAEGELAFYYHGPRLSMVTVGVFGPDDWDPQMPQYQSERLRATRKRHPLNLYNGQGIRERRPGISERLQPSVLVAIPER